MTKKERIIKAISHEETDIVPYSICFTKGAYEKIIDYYGDEQISDRIGNHLGGPTTNDAWEEIRPDYFRDQFGVVWNRTVDKDIGVIEGIILKDKNFLDKYIFPDPYKEGRFSLYAEYLRDNPDTFNLSNLGFSLFERAWTLRGMENLLIDMVDDTSFVDELLNRILAWNLATISQALKYGIDGVMFGDDWGQQHGLIMGPQLWRRFIKPRLAAMYKMVKDNGKSVFIHSCGDIREILPDLIEIGVDVFNPFQPEVMDVYAIKKKYGDKLCFFGGVSTQRLLPYGTPEEIKNTVKNLAKEIGRGGGYIISPAHAIPGDVPLENILALINFLKEQREPRQEDT